MATILADLKYKVDSSQIRRAKGDIGDLGTASKKGGKGIASLSTMMKGLGVAAIAVTGVLKLTDVMAKMGEQGLKTADNIGKTADKLGITTTEIQEFQIVAEAAGVSMETFNMGFQRFTRRLGETRRGTGALAKAFDQLGIETDDSSGKAKSATQIFKEYGEAVAGIKDPALQLSFAMSAVDSEGVKMVNMWRMNKEEQEKVIATARKYGAVIDESVIRKSEEWNTELGLIQKGTAALETQTQLAMVPVTIMWAKFKNEIAQTTIALMDFFGRLDDFKATDVRISLLSAEYEELNRKVVAYNQTVDKGNGISRGMSEFQMFLHKRRMKEIEEEMVGLQALYAKEKKHKREQEERMAGGGLGLNLNLKPEKIEEPTEDPVIDDYKRRTSVLQQEIDKGRQIRISNMEDEREQIIAQTEFEIEQINRRTAALMQSYEFSGAERNRLEDATNEQIVQKRVEMEAKIQGLSEETNNILKNGTDSWISGASQSMVDFAQTGENSFAQMTASILSNIAKMILQQQIFIALQTVSMAMGGGGGDSGNVVNSASQAAALGFAKGGVVSKQQRFAMGDGVTGLMGEAGPEGILPLKRTKNGDLGVVAVGGGGEGGGSGGGGNEINYYTTVNVQGGDNPADTGQKIAEAFVTAIVKKEMASEKRPGGIFNSTTKLG